MIREGKERGYYVCTNTTVYRETDVAEIEEMCAFLTDLDVDGILLSPGYHYEAIPGDDHFLYLDEIHAKFRRIVELAKRYRKISSTPLFLQFAAGLRDYPVHAVGQPDVHAEGLEGAVLPDRGAALRELEGLLRRRRLGLLGEPEGSPLPRLQDAFGLRGVGRPEAGRALLGRRHDGALAARERPQPGRAS
jgi:hypothetical protein